jgi:hypothetical protein
VKREVVHVQLLGLGVAYRHDGYIPGVLPQWIAVERTGPQPGVIDTDRKVSESPDSASLVRPGFFRKVLNTKDYVGGGQSRNRTKDTRIFNPLLYQLS